MGLGEAPEQMDLEEFVLTEFGAEEEETVEKTIERACAALAPGARP